MLRFDSASFKAHLSGLPGLNVAVFALSCAERTLCVSPLPSALSNVVRFALDSGESFVLGDVSRDQVRLALEALEKSTELDADPFAAAAYALRFVVTGALENAIWAAQRSYDAADALAQQSMEFDEFSGGVESLLLGSTVVQAMLACQRQDLDSLKVEFDAKGIFWRARLFSW